MFKQVAGYEVYIENGYIIRGIKNGVTAYVYRQVKDGWKKEDKITEAAFRSGVRRGTVDLK